MTSHDYGLQGQPVKAVLLDLDGTVLDTESLVLEVVKTVVESHGKQLTADVAARAAGMRPLEAWAAVAASLGIDRTPEQLFNQSEPLLRDKWHEAPLMPGVARLVAHLRQHNVPLALATSTPRATLERKLSRKADMQQAFVHSCCGDEVDRGKPAPDCFLHLARRLGLAPDCCLVIEDAPAGVEAAVAAGMRVVAVPSLLGHGGQPSSLYPEPRPGAASGCVSVLPSLLEFRPEQYGLPPFTDYVAGTIPMRPVIKIRGTVVKGFGRGSKQLGIPTANVDDASLRMTLADAVTGIFAGWVSVGDSPTVYKTAVSIGFNPVFANPTKTCEPWILHDFGNIDLCGSEIRVVICAYIRPEANFPSLEALIQRIHKDGEVSRQALEEEVYAHHRQDAFLLPHTTSPSAQHSNVVTGN